MEDPSYNIKKGTATVEVKEYYRINIAKLLKIMDVNVGDTVKIIIEKVE